MSETVGAGEFKTFKQLSELVEDRGGVLTTTMGVVREVAGAGRLGVHVRAEISKSLADEGLSHNPDPLPQYQEELVRIYRSRSRVAQVIDAAGNPGDAQDRVLREVATDGASEVLERVRELVCKK